MIRVNLDNAQCVRCGKVYYDHEESPFCSRSCFNVAVWEQQTLENFKELFKSLCTNFNRSPWTREQGVSGALQSLQGELDELKEAYAAKDPTHVQEELGDVFWNCITLALACQRECIALTPQTLAGASKKLHDRKPWIFDGSEITHTAEEEQTKYLQMKARLKEEKA